MLQALTVLLPAVARAGASAASVATAAALTATARLIVVFCIKLQREILSELSHHSKLADADSERELV